MRNQLGNIPLWVEQNPKPSNISKERRSHQAAASDGWSPLVLAAGQPGFGSWSPWCPAGRVAAAHTLWGPSTQGSWQPTGTGVSPKAALALPVCGRDAGERAEVTQGWADGFMRLRVSWYVSENSEVTSAPPEAVPRCWNPGSAGTQATAMQSTVLAAAACAGGTS